MENKKNVGLATASLVLGIFAIVPLGLLAGIPAVICGHLAKSRIKKSPEELTGGGKATAGLIMGYFSFITPILAAIAIPLMAGNKDLAVGTEAQAGCMQIATAMQMYNIEHGNLDDVSHPQDLDGIQPGDLDGHYYSGESYMFTSLEDVSNYTVVAVSEGDEDARVSVTMTVTDGQIDWDID